jgi:hypothetical protein
MSGSLLSVIRAAGLKAYEKQGHPQTTLNSVTCERTCRCGYPIAGITEGAESCESYGTFEPCKATQGNAIGGVTGHTLGDQTFPELGGSMSGRLTAVAQCSLQPV